MIHGDFAHAAVVQASVDHGNQLVPAGITPLGPAAGTAGDVDAIEVRA
jgi:hypothetical protein